MIPISDIRRHLAIPDNLDDLTLELVLADAIGMVEHDAGIILQRRNFKQLFDHFYCDLYIRHTPITAISAIEYRDTADVWQTVSPSVYLISGEVFYEFGEENEGDDYYLYPEIRLQTDADWPDDVSDKKDSVRITYAAGFLNHELPRAARRAILLACGTLFENREALAPVVLSEVPAYQMAVAPIKKPVMAR